MNSVRSLDDIIGQDDVVRRLRTLADLHGGAGRQMPHFLLVGDRGKGKRTIVDAFAQEYGWAVREMDPHAVSRPKDLAAFLSSFREHDILLLSRLAPFSRSVLDTFKPALQDFRLDVVIGEGPTAQAYKLQLPRFTCIGLAETANECPPALRELFDVVIELGPYQPPAMRRLVSDFVTSQGVTAEDEVIDLLASISEGTPGYAWKLVSWLGVRGGQKISLDDARVVLGAHGVILPRSTSRPSAGDWETTTARGFEALVGGLLSRQGFKVELTSLSNDGGVDIIASLDRPFVGGRYLIQCKKYAEGNAVGVQTVREFYGVLRADSRAVKGILITTSTFTPQAFEFAKDLPIDLVDGAQLRRLVEAMSGTGEAPPGQSMA